MGDKNEHRWDIQQVQPTQHQDAGDHWQPLTIAVGSVEHRGQSSELTAKLAIAMAQAGNKVVLIDADLAHDGKTALFDPSSEGPTLDAFLEQEVISLNQTVHPSGIRNLSLIPAAGLRPEAADISNLQQKRLQRSLRRLEADVVILEMGEAADTGIWDFFTLADHRLVVTSPHTKALPGTYMLLKATVNRLLEMLTGQARKSELLAEVRAVGSEDTLSGLLDRMEQSDPGHAALCRAALKNYHIGLVLNGVETEGDKRIGLNMARTSRFFLSSPVNLSAILGKEEAALGASGNDEPLFPVDAPVEVAPAVQELANRLLYEDLPGMRKKRWWTPEGMLQRSNYQEKT